MNVMVARNNDYSGTVGINKLLCKVIEKFSSLMVLSLNHGIRINRVQPRTLNQVTAYYD